MEPFEGVLLTEVEKKLLEAYYRLEELQLETALLKAQDIISQDEPANLSERDIDAAQYDLLKARAAFQIRKNVTESVLIASPIISSIHAGQITSIYEEELVTLMKRRDELSLSLIDTSKRERDARKDLVDLEVEHIHIVDENAKLSKKLHGLANSIDEPAGTQGPDGQPRGKIVDMETEMKISHRKWMFMKGAVSAIIVASGVDWARRSDLLHIVLNEED